ncbi:MAG TPA: TonB-dependent receptor [Novosphingobium sp.]|nr:TonB-dependent receptor [Novosphingobium sp.]
MRLAAHTSLIAITLGWAAAAAAQEAARPAPAGNAADAAADAPAAAEIVVTGSSLKGVAPVGSNLATLARAQIDNTSAQTIQQVLKSAPAVTGLQAPSQGGFGSSDNSGTNAPTIHGLGASASNSTLILMNGHRLPTSGANHMLADPNIIPTIALERVEVLADGASSVYGSDAVAGVINFITRKNFNGLEADVQKGFADHYNTFSASVLAGKTWDTGSFLAAYSYSYRSSLAASARGYASSVNFAGRGGNNANASNKCASPSITSGGNTYYNTGSAYSTEPAGYGSQAGGGCTPTAWDLLPQEVRHTAYMQVRQDVGDKLHLVADFDYSYRKNTQNISRGTATATIYGQGSTPPSGRSINPYFQSLNLGGSTPTSYTLNFDANQLLGTGAKAIGSAEDFYGHLDAIYDLSTHWQINLGGLIGRDHSQIINSGTLNTAAFALAVNGYTSAAVNGATVANSQTLTSANAFDPFTGQTSSATLAALTDSTTYYSTFQTVRNAYLKASGDLFRLPGGHAKLAVGGELLGYAIDQSHTALNGLGGASSNSTFLRLHYGRNVTSLFGELYLPLVKDSFVKSIDLNISGRYDRYSDFGTTANPKLAANFEPVRGIKLRGNWSRSFVAPALTSIGANSSGQTGESAFTYTTGANNLSTLPGGLAAVPLSLYPGAASIPGAVCNATTCNLTSVTGAVISGGNARLKPQTGKDWSIGFDFTPVQLPGFKLSMTYWNDELRNGITAPQTVYALTAASLSNLLTLYPAGATVQQIAAAQGSLPQSGATTAAYFIYNYTQNNVLNLNVSGIDVEAMYRFDSKIGHFTLDGSFTRKTKFEQWFGADGTHFSVLGTAGFNTTFPSLKMEGRANIAYDKGPFNAVLGINYEGPYTWWGSGVVNPIVRNAAGVPVGGGDHVGAFTTIDLHAAYTLEHIGALKKANLYVDITNLFDKAPPFVNTVTTNGNVGYDGFSANPLGRVVSIGLRSKF